MRTIKFRAWDMEARQMRTVDELMNLWSQYSDEDEKKNPGIKTVPHVTVVNQQYRGEDLKLVVGKDCELMQFTGLLDKNGKEIYEGDIIIEDVQNEMGSFTREIPLEVYFNSVIGAFRAEDRKDKIHDWSIGKNSEIIGNIYENPDLLPTPPRE